MLTFGLTQISQAHGYYGYHPHGYYHHEYYRPYCGRPVYAPRVLLPVPVPPVAYYAPRLAYVPGHWVINRWGERVWIRTYCR